MAEFLERQLACELLPTAYHALQTSGWKLLEWHCFSFHTFSAFWLWLMGLQLVTCLSHVWSVRECWTEWCSTLLLSSWTYWSTRFATQTGWIRKRTLPSTWTGWTCGMLKALVQHPSWRVQFLEALLWSLGRRLPMPVASTGWSSSRMRGGSWVKLLKQKCGGQSFFVQRKRYGSYGCWNCRCFKLWGASLCRVSTRARVKVVHVQRYHWKIKTTAWNQSSHYKLVLGILDYDCAMWGPAQKCDQCLVFLDPCTCSCIVLRRGGIDCKK